MKAKFFFSIALTTLFLLFSISSVNANISRNFGCPQYLDSLMVYPPDWECIVSGQSSYVQFIPVIQN